MVQWFEDAGIRFNNGASFLNFMSHAHEEAKFTMSADEIAALSDVLSAYGPSQPRVIRIDRSTGTITTVLSGGFAQTYLQADARVSSIAWDYAHDRLLAVMQEWSRGGWTTLVAVTDPDTTTDTVTVVDAAPDGESIINLSGVMIGSAPGTSAHRGG